LDLVESYLAVYPDREESLMYDMEQLPYFYSPATCQPRSKKYVATLSFGGKGEHVQQLGATTWDNDKTTKQVGSRAASQWRVLGRSFCASARTAPPFVRTCV